MILSKVMRRQSWRRAQGDQSQNFEVSKYENFDIIEKSIRYQTHA